MTNKISNMVVAMEGWDEQITPDLTPPSGLFGRKIKIKTGDVTINGATMDVEFSIPFDDDTEANEAEITVYNLEKTTLEQIKKDAKLTVTAGYGDDTGIIFSGRVSKKKSKYVGLDKQTVIYAIDREGEKERKIKSISYKKGVKASYILKDLIKRLKLPIAVFKMRKDYTYKDAVTVSGKLLENIKQYSEVCGVSTYIHKGKIYSRHIKDGDNIKFELSVATGLLESPEPFEEEYTGDGKHETIKGYKVKMLLQHRVGVASKIKIKSKNVSGTYRVRKGTHSFNGTDFITEVEVI